MKSGTITLAQLKGKFEETLKAEKPAPVKQDNEQIAKEAFLKRKAQIKELRKLLHSTYPNVFDYENPKPLAIGINKLIKAVHPQCSHKTVQFFIINWVKNPRYLKAIIASEYRVDLNNLKSSTITQEQKKFAQAMLDKRNSTKIS